MTKQELLDDFSSKEYCGKLLGTVEVPLAEDDLKTTNKIKWYHVHFMEIVGNVVKGRKISIYVFDEGTAKETAYYGDNEPQQSIQITP